MVSTLVKHATVSTNGDTAITIGLGRRDDDPKVLIATLFLSLSGSNGRRTSRQTPQTVGLASTSTTLGVLSGRLCHTFFISAGAGQKKDNNCNLCRKTALFETTTETMLCRASERSTDRRPMTLPHNFAGRFLSKPSAPSRGPGPRTRGKME